MSHLSHIDGESQLYERKDCLHKYICQPLSALVSIGQRASLPGHVPFIIDKPSARPCFARGGGLCPPQGFTHLGKSIQQYNSPMYFNCFDNNSIWAKGPSAPSHSENHVSHSIHSIKCSIKYYIKGTFGPFAF